MQRTKAPQPRLLQEQFRHLLDLLSPEQKDAVECGDVGNDEFRLWSNPELYVNPGETDLGLLAFLFELGSGGLRLVEVALALQHGVHKILEASLSKDGYDKTLGCCYSYNFRLFSPSLYTTSSNVRNQEAFIPENAVVLGLPWDFTFFGHHLCLSVIFLGHHIVIGPTFMGPEPDVIDEGPHAGLRLFKEEELAALKLMQSLPAALQESNISPRRWTDSLFPMAAGTHLTNAISVELDKTTE